MNQGLQLSTAVIVGEAASGKRSLQDQVQLRTGQPPLAWHRSLDLGPYRLTVMYILYGSSVELLEQVAEWLPQVGLSNSGFVGRIQDGLLHALPYDAVRVDFVAEKVELVRPVDLPYAGKKIGYIKRQRELVPPLPNRHRT